VMPQKRPSRKADRSSLPPSRPTTRSGGSRRSRTRGCAGETPIAARECRTESPNHAVDHLGLAGDCEI
jgi:hypothetical protein